MPPLSRLRNGPKCRCGESDPDAFYPSKPDQCRRCHARQQRQRVRGKPTLVAVSLEQAAAEFREAAHLRRLAEALQISVPTLKEWGRTGPPKPPRVPRMTITRRIALFLQARKP